MRPDDLQRMRPPDRMLLTRVPQRRQWLSQTLWWLVIMAGIVVIVLGNDRQIFWMSAAGLVVTLLGLFASVRDYTARYRAQPAFDDARADELVAGRPREFVMRRQLVYGWPLTLTIMSIPFFVMAVRSGTEPAPVIVGVALFVACIVSWYLVLRLQAPFLRLTSEGLELNGSLIAWRRVAALRADSALPLFNRRSQERGRMLVILYEPLPEEEFPRGALGRFFRGDNAKELVISLARTVETPAVVYQIAQDFWQRARDRRA